MDGKRLKDLIEKRSTIWTIGFCMTGIIVLGSIASLERAQRTKGRFVPGTNEITF